jgi:hypothetical protein
VTVVTGAALGVAGAASRPTRPLKDDGGDACSIKLDTSLSKIPSLKLLPAAMDDAAACAPPAVVEDPGASTDIDCDGERADGTVPVL